jgi:hypothetical protein
VPDVPGIRDQVWTPAERCGGTPEVLATQYVAVERPLPPDPVPPATDPPQPVVVVIVIVQPAEPATPTPMLEPEREPFLERSSVEEPHVPVQLPFDSP